MKNLIKLAILSLGAGLSLPALSLSGKEVYKMAGSEKLIDESNKYSMDLASKEEQINDILKAVGVQYLNELDPNLIYTLDTNTNTVSTKPTLSSDASLSRSSSDVDSISMNPEPCYYPPERLQSLRFIKIKLLFSALKGP